MMPQNNSTKKQVKNVPNPTGKGGFQERPQDRGSGQWKPENTISYQYRRFLNMTPTELKAFASVPDKDRTVAMDIAYSRVLASRKSLQDVKEITDRTEGKSPQNIDLTTGGESLNTLKKLTDEEIRERIERYLDNSN